MKERENKILNLILQKGSISHSDIENKFNISRRSVYYDIANINYEIRKFGKIINKHGEFTYVGEAPDIAKGNSYINKETRERYIQYLLFTENFNSTDCIADMLEISRNTVVACVNNIKTAFAADGINLIYKDRYIISGNEEKIRKNFILLDQYPFVFKMDASDEVVRFNKLNNLKLTDYSLASLSHLVEFIKKRIKTGNFLKNLGTFQVNREFLGVEELIGCDSKAEIEFISAYIMTLSNADISKVDTLDIENKICMLVSKFEQITGKKIEEKVEFISNLKQHFLASYYRIKFDFPIYNPFIDDIKNKYSTLFSIIKGIIKNEYIMSNSHRDEEIAYIVAYFGGFIYNEAHRQIRIVIVCPNGLVISKTLKIQLERQIENISIIDVMSVSEFFECDYDYDYVISTIPLDVKNAIIVSPLLSEGDIMKINKKIARYSEVIRDFNVEEIMDIIEKNCDILDRLKLEKELHKYLEKKNKKESADIMLKDLLTIDKIARIDKVSDYKEAITIASKPLIDDNSIEPTYVEAIFDALDKFGPYIVLADKFALPHASNSVGVNKIGMSILVVDETVDLMGKEVNIFCVLASVDSDSHIGALAELAEMFYDEKNIEYVLHGSCEDIYKLIQKETK